MCCKGKEIEFTDNRTDYEKEFSENLFKMMQQGMAQGATPMPPEMYQALMGAYAVPSTAYGGMNILNNLAGQGPTQFNPLSMFQPQVGTLDYDWDDDINRGPGGGYHPAHRPNEPLPKNQRPGGKMQRGYDPFDIWRESQNRNTG